MVGAPINHWIYQIYFPFFSPVFAHLLWTLSPASSYKMGLKNLLQKRFRFPAFKKKIEILVDDLGLLWWRHVICCRQRDIHIGRKFKVGSAISKHQNNKSIVYMHFEDKYTYKLYICSLIVKRKYMRLYLWCSWENTRNKTPLWQFDL